MRRAHYVLGLVGLMAITACSDIGQPYNTPYPELVCIAADGLQAQVDALRDLDPATATVQQYQTAAYNVAGYAETMVDQARTLADAEAGQVAVAFSELEDAARALPAGTTPEAARTELSDEIDAAKASVTSLTTKLNCQALPSAAPTT